MVEEDSILITINGILTIPAFLNNTMTAKAFKKNLPYHVTTSKSEYDFCGQTPDLPSDNNEHQAGWRNGDIGYSKGWFALFHDGEQESSSYTNEMIIGHIDESYLEKLRKINGTVQIDIKSLEN